jgi:hypothetical protein
MRIAFPETADAMTVRAVGEGVRLADDLIRNTPLLSTAIGRDYRGLIRRAGVMFSFNEACVRGDLPFQSSFRQMHRGHWHLLEINSGVERAQICRTDEADAFPEDTPVKQDERLVNQFDLFQEPLPPVESILAKIPRLYVWLTFGSDYTGTLTHVCWCAPAKEEKQWLAFENILRRSSGSGVVPAPVGSPTPDPKSKLRFKDHIEEALEKKNDKSSA